MPLVRIDTFDAIHDATARGTFGEVVYDALRAIGVPEGDRFQILAGHASGAVVYGSNYLGIERTDGFVAIQITLNAGRTLAQKRSLFAAIADGLARLGVRREDVFVNLVETAKENWSFGNGEAQYAEAG
ncbi:phenylpyruvate tautomerase PptA (4-oxalocrotonate tautomerase family) [Endobacter medicaginis]|uniref:Phenylpyruvate tautomerase PptA (4-oxalocrotonate tautomerase family) n=1 Tax=Endobacter medicaginis TaxID=1181271 RepID=A0A839V593_9PROT|nr:tautomerase family protein [Endobacter medicaginis]MBB3174712.1 phenylpyruvate tautomerase PptA (4-oxalocrotonate tautomerase family) [Endobacter medicaginis]MCX5474893.1 tautomerase family protein [Endobacter medicaginis]NVN29490.1 tautomerase family protein [Endobacter medicaginis]